MMAAEWMTFKRFAQRKEMPSVSVFIGTPEYPADGHWIKLPLTDEEVERELSMAHEEYILSDIDTDLKMLRFHFDVWDRLPDLNRLVRTIADYYEKGWNEMRLFLMAWDKRAGDIEETIAFLEQGSYEFYPDVDDIESLGHAVADCGKVRVPGGIRHYIDFEAIGRDWWASGCSIDEELECAFMETSG